MSDENISKCVCNLWANQVSLITELVGGRLLNYVQQSSEFQKPSFSR